MDSFSDLFDYWFPDGLYHPKFLDEVDQMLRNELSGKEKEFVKATIQQLTFVRELGKDVNLADSNEILRSGGEQQFYSLHLKRKQFNIRFLIAFEDNIPLFLCAFFERSGKRQTDYTTYNPVLRSRLTELLKEGTFYD